MSLADVATQNQPTGAEIQAEVQEPVIELDGDEQHELDTQNQIPNVEEELDPDLGGTDDDGEGFINQEAVNKRINKLTFEKHEERRRRESLEAENQRLKAQISAPQEKDIVVPDMPDPFDPEYSAKVAERDKALQEKAKQDALRDSAQAHTQTQAQVAAQAVQKRIDTQVAAMHKQAKDIGMTAEEIAQADKRVAMFLPSPAVAQYLLGREDSGYITKYLASSASSLEKLSTLNAAEAAVFIDRTIAPRAAKFKPQTPGAPDPITVPKGKARTENNPYLQGVTME